MKKQIIQTILISVLFILWIPSILLADTIKLKNGKTYSGRIIGQSLSSIRIRTSRGTKTLSKSKIRNVKFGVTNNEKVIQQKRKKELAKRRKNLELARKANKTKQIAREKRRIDALHKQEKKETRELEKRESVVLNAEEEVLKLQNEETNLEKRLAIIRKKRRALEHKDESAMAYIWRSALIPGWGQARRGDTARGITLGTGFLMGAGAMASFHSKHAGAKANYESQVNTGLLLYMANADQNTILYQSEIAAREAQTTMETHAKNFQTASLFIGIVYLYNVFDAWFFTDAVAMNTPSHNSSGLASGFQLLLGDTTSFIEGKANNPQHDFATDHMRFAYTFQY